MAEIFGDGSLLTVADTISMSPKRLNHFLENHTLKFHFIFLKKFGYFRLQLVTLRSAEVMKDG